MTTVLGFGENQILDLQMGANPSCEAGCRRFSEWHWEWRELTPQFYVNQLVDAVRLRNELVNPTS
jgi:hypothetical protein